MNYLYRIIRYPSIYLAISTLLVLLVMSVVAWLTFRDIEGDNEIPLVKTLGSYAATLESGTVSSRAMGAAILFGQENKEAKQLVLGKLQPDAPEVLSALDALRTLYIADTVFLVNKQGVVVAYSNKGNERGTGHDLSFRPYVQLGMQGTPNVYPAVGVINPDRGIYLAAPLRSSANNASGVIGAIVIKVGADKLDALLKTWKDGIAVLLSPQGVVFAANREDWLFRTTGEMNANRLADIRRTRQFGKVFDQNSFLPLPVTFDQPETSIDGMHYAVRSLPLEWNDPEGDWKLVFFEPRDPWWTYWGVLGFAGLSGLIAALGFFALYSLARNAFMLKNMNAMLQRNDDVLRKNDELLKETQIIANLGSYVLDIPSGRWESSVILDNIFGISKTYDRSVQGWTALVHPDDRSMMADYLTTEVINRGREFDKEFRIIRNNDQTERWVHGLGKIKFSVQGKPVQLHGTVQDITERKDDETQIAKSLSLLNATLESTHDAILVVDLNNVWVLYNQKFIDLWHITDDIIFAKDDQAALSYVLNQLEDADGFLRKVLELYAIPQASSFDTINFKDGRIIERYSVPQRIGGKVVGRVWSFHDATERKQAERALKGSLYQLEEKELAKTRFLAAAGHDLRQPLAAANLFIDALRFTDPSPDQNQIIQRLEQAMVTFNGLLDALLNISKLDAGAIKPEYSLIDVAEIFQWLEQNFAPVAGEKQLGFKLFFPMKETIVIHSDIGLINSVLMNLVSNAIKYTHKGAILVSARRRGSDVLFQVWDTGIGINEDHFEHIFDEFYQINNPQRDRSRGLGLGLSIAKRALALLGSEITCRSRSGHGSVFGFSLPLDISQNEVMQQTATVESKEEVNQEEFVRGKHFIVVEDDALVAEAMCRTLEVMGGEVKHFHRAEDALNHTHIEHADYYIVDYMLGGTLNGIQFLNQLRQKVGKPINAVLVTGDTSPAFVRGLADCDWPVLHKPANISKLIACLSSRMRHA